MAKQCRLHDYLSSCRALALRCERVFLPPGLPEDTWRKAVCIFVNQKMGSMLSKHSLFWSSLSRLETAAHLWKYISKMAREPPYQRRDIKLSVIRPTHTCDWGIMLPLIKLDIWSDYDRGKKPKLPFLSSLLHDALGSCKVDLRFVPISEAPTIRRFVPIPKQKKKPHLDS